MNDHLIRRTPGIVTLLRPVWARAGSTCAPGHKACRDNRSVQYQRIPRLFEALALARGDGRYGRLLKTIGRVQLLILEAERRLRSRLAKSPRCFRESLRPPNPRCIRKGYFAALVGQNDKDRHGVGQIVFLHDRKSFDVINQLIRLREKDFERLLAHRHQIIDDNEVKTMRIRTRGGPASRFSDFQQHAALDCSTGREPPDAAASANNVNQRCAAIKCVSIAFHSLPRGIGCLG